MSPYTRHITAMSEPEKNINTPNIAPEYNSSINVNTRNKLEKLSSHINPQPNSPTIISENRECKKVTAGFLL